MVLGLKIIRRNIVADEAARNGWQDGKSSRKHPPLPFASKSHLRKLLQANASSRGPSPREFSLSRVGRTTNYIKSRWRATEKETHSQIRTERSDSPESSWRRSVCHSAETRHLELRLFIQAAERALDFTQNPPEIIFPFIFYLISGGQKTIFHFARCVKIRSEED